MQIMLVAYEHPMKRFWHRGLCVMFSYNCISVVQAKLLTSPFQLKLFFPAVLTIELIIHDVLLVNGTFIIICP